MVLDIIFIFVKTETESSRKAYVVICPLGDGMVGPFELLRVS